MRYNILVTSAGGDIGGNIISILKKQNLFKCSIVGTDIKKHIFSEADLNYFYQVCRVDKLEYTKEIKEIIDKHKIDLIIPSSEYDILFLHKHISLFKSLDVKLLINSKKIVETFLNKKETATILNDLNIATPATYTLDKYNNELTFPLILKAISSTTSKIIKKITNMQELTEARLAIAEENKFIIQKYIGTMEEEYTTAVYRDKRITKVITFKRLLYEGKTGYAEIENSKILHDYAVKITQEFNLRGSINIQSRKHNDNFYIFEINPRISSTVYIRDHFKFEDLIWWISDILKIDVNIDATNLAREGIAILGYRYRFYNEKDLGNIK